MASCTALGCSLAGTCEAFGLEVGQAESELAAECIRNAHWEGTQAWTEGKWTVLNKQQFSHDWSFTYKARDGSNAVVDLEAWEESLRGLLTDVPPDDFYWNVKLHVPDDGFEIFDELIEVPYRVSPVARVPVPRPVADRARLPSGVLHVHALRPVLARGVGARRLG